MPASHRLLYLCRNCSALVPGPAVADLAAALASLAGIGRAVAGTDGPDVPAVGVHDCGAGRMGLMDLIGGDNTATTGG